MTSRTLNYAGWRLIKDWGGNPLMRRGDWSDSSLSRSCPFCRAIAFRAVPFASLSSGLHAAHASGSICTDCGWWEAKGDYVEDDAPYELHRHIYAELASTDLRPLRSPAFSLAHGLRASYRQPGSMSPRAFEELVAAVFREHLNCRVELTKQTRDGGKDLVCLNSAGGKFLVEVKRHTTRPVGVAVVHRFAGVLYQDRVDHGIVVTSTRFTRDARRAVERINERSTILKLELRDQRDILSWLDAFCVKDEGAVVDLVHGALREAMCGLVGAPRREAARDSSANAT